jgi:hypothetical protein
MVLTSNSAVWWGWGKGAEGVLWIITLQRKPYFHGGRANRRSFALLGRLLRTVWRVWRPVCERACVCVLLLGARRIGVTLAGSLQVGALFFSTTPSRRLVHR